MNRFTGNVTRYVQKQNRRFCRICVPRPCPPPTGYLTNSLRKRAPILERELRSLMRMRKIASRGRQTDDVNELLPAETKSVRKKTHSKLNTGTLFQGTILRGVSIARGVSKSRRVRALRSEKMR